MEKTKHFGLALVAGLSVAAILLAVVKLLPTPQTLAIYNLVRAILFAAACIFLHQNPSRVDFMGSLKLSDSGNASDLNIKISLTLSYLFSVVSLAISIALFLDS